MENDMMFTPSFDFHCLLRDLKKNLWLVLLAALIAVMGLYVASHSIYTPVYTSSATLVVRAKVGTTGAYTNLSASSEMAKIYAEVFEQPSIEELAAAYMGEEDFQGSISASIMGATNFIRLSVTAEEPERAFQNLCAVLEIYPNVSSAVFSNAVIDVIVDPQVPMGPSNSISNTRQSQIVLMAMLLQCCLIAAISYLRSTVKNEKVYLKHVDAKLLGTVAHEIPHLSLQERILRKKRALLLNDGYASLKFAEDYQKIATKLEWIRKKTQSKIFTITSVGENEGKSTAASNLAIALARRGHRVMLVDLDIKKPAIFKIFRYRRVSTSEIVTLFSKAPEITPDFFETFRYRNTNLFLALNKQKHTVGSEWVSSKQVSEWIQAFADGMDYVILDTSPLVVSADAVSLVEISDQTILVVRTDRSAIADINDAAMTITSGGGVLAGCILNDVYKPFTFFDQIGTDSGGYYTYRYGSYKRYGRYEQTVRRKGTEKKPDVSSNAQVKDGQKEL